MSGYVWQRSYQPILELDRYLTAVGVLQASFLDIICPLVGRDLEVWNDLDIDYLPNGFSSPW